MWKTYLMFSSVISALENRNDTGTIVTRETIRV